MANLTPAASNAKNERAFSIEGSSQPVCGLTRSASRSARPRQRERHGRRHEHVQELRIAVFEAAIGLRLRQQWAHEAVEHLDDGQARRVAAESGHMRRLGRQLVLRIECGGGIERSLLNDVGGVRLAHSRLERGLPPQRQRS